MSAKKFINAAGAQVADNTNSLTAGPRGPVLLSSCCSSNKNQLFVREVSL
jgi:catalase